MGMIKLEQPVGYYGEGATPWWVNPAFVASVEPCGVKDQCIVALAGQPHARRVLGSPEEVLERIALELSK